MKTIFFFLEQISNSVLPYNINNVINSPCLRLFRFVACISIIVLFMFKSSLSSYSINILLIITYNYMLYKCIVVIIKIYYTHYMVMTNNTKIIYGNIPLSHIRTLYNILILLVVITGIPVITDTLLEIIGDVKYISKQILEKIKNKR